MSTTCSVLFSSLDQDHFEHLTIKFAKNCWGAPVKIEDFEYSNLVDVLEPYVAKGLPESASFLNWFLEHIFRLDDVAAHDAICDKSNDKGIDGIYVDEFSEELLFLQSKVRQKTGATLGDTALKEFAGSIGQFDTPQKIEAVLAGNANAELKKLLTSLEIRQKLEKGYSIKGVFVCNQDPDVNATQFLAAHPAIRLYDRARLASEFIDLDQASGVSSTFSLTCDQAPLQLEVSNLAELFLFAALASELVNLPGISDGQLFSQNVRLGLGNTEVNKAIIKTLSDSTEHKKFPLFHNGITLLCEKAKLESGKLEITNFVVVNGAQSLTAIFHNKSKVTTDLKLLLRVIQISGNEDLSRQITQNSNNQNAIKPRDLRSNHQIQTRLKREFEQLSFENYVLEVKRGEANEGKAIISNEEAGRLLLAFDLAEPWACHQIYKVFDELYTRIFGRPEVTATRIVFMKLVMDVVQKALGKIENQPFASYTLTRFFVLDVVAHVLRSDEVARSFVIDPSPLLSDDVARNKFFSNLENIVSGVVVDLNYEARQKGESFDYKSLLKSQKECRDLSGRLISTLDRDVARGKAERFSDLWAKT